MRLMINRDVRGLAWQDLLILCRHGVDDNTLTVELNQPLIEETKEDIVVLGDEISEFGLDIGIPSFGIDSSNRLRAIQTADILADQIRKAEIEVVLSESDRIREIKQGDFIIKDHVDGEDYQPLLDAWSVWQQKLDDCELLYRFGDPLIDSMGGARYPELVGWFNEFGENQQEFSIRLYLYLLDLISGPVERFPVVVCHQATCSRIQRILSAISRIESAGVFDPGQFVKYLEKEGSRYTINPACGVVLSRPSRELSVAVLQKEIDYLSNQI